MIGLIDYGMGNIHSLMSASEYLGLKIKICNNKNDLKLVEKIILPGVGAFGKCIEILKNQDLLNELNFQVLKNKKKILVICLGMQIMSTKSIEFGETKGLNWIEGTVKEINVNIQKYRLPHVGWNTINLKKKSPLFLNINNEDDFYFVHSYSVQNSNSDDVLATFNYSTELTASINKDNIYGVQFHPEKCQDTG